MSEAAGSNGPKHGPKGRFERARNDARLFAEDLNRLFDFGRRSRDLSGAATSRGLAETV